MSRKYLKKKVRDEVDFWINLKVSCKSISTLWPSRFPRNWVYHWYSWASILKLLKVKRLYYLYNITKKEVRSWVHFVHIDKHQSFSKLALSCYMEVARPVQSTQRKLVIFLQFFKKIVSQMQNIHISYGVSSHVRCYLFLSVASFPEFATLFEVVSCIFKLKDFSCSNSVMLHPFIKLGH